MPRQARSQNGTATLEGGEDSLFFMGGSSTMGSLKGGHPYKAGNKPATQNGGYDDDADDATDQPAFDDSDSDDDSSSMDDSGDDDSEGYDDSSDDDSGAEMDDGSGDDDESMGSRGTKRMRSRKASTKRASTKRAATKKASDTFNLEGSTSEIVRLREEVATYRLAIYRNEVHKQTLQLTERLSDAAPSRVFAQAFERFMLSDDGYRLSPHVRGEILKLCDLALKRGVVDLRRLGSGRDIERRTTTARNQGQGGGAKGLPTDGDELVEEAERMALSEGKLKMGRKFAELPTAEKDHYMSEAYRLLSDD